MWNVKSPYDQVIPLVGIYPGEIKTPTQKLAQGMFTKALLIVTTVWGQLRCLQTEEWIN